MNLEQMYKRLQELDIKINNLEMGFEIDEYQKERHALANKIMSIECEKIIKENS